MKKMLYSGSFDPMTKGHYDLIRRGAKMADELIVGIIGNVVKTPMFTLEERREMIALQVADLPNVRVEFFEGLLVDYVKKNEIDAVLRGLRSASDFEYEIQMAQVNAMLYDKMETVFLMTDQRYSFISSSAVREVASVGGEVREMVPDRIYEYICRRKIK